VSAPDPTRAPILLRLFGPFEVLLNGRPLPRLRTRKGEWLLALLALRAGRGLDRAWLADTLWPETPLSQALLNLRVSLNDLRRALGSEAACLGAAEERERGRRRILRLDPAGVAVDVVASDAAVARGDAAALVTYRELREVLHRELNAEPHAESTARFQQIRAQARSKAALGSATSAASEHARWALGSRCRAARDESTCGAAAPPTQRPAPIAGAKRPSTTFPSH
jgi:DNA-binding SARP family transcriptional activator